VCSHFFETNKLVDCVVCSAFSLQNVKCINTKFDDFHFGLYHTFYFRWEAAAVKKTRNSECDPQTQTSSIVHIGIFVILVKTVADILLS
jgi:hypothetical protein